MLFGPANHTLAKRGRLGASLITYPLFFMSIKTMRSYLYISGFTSKFCELSKWLSQKFPPSQPALFVFFFKHSTCTCKHLQCVGRENKNHLGYSSSHSYTVMYMLRVSLPNVEHVAAQPRADGLKQPVCLLRHCHNCIP